MLGRLVRILLGFERMKQRGDRLFLSGDFQNAQRQYERARTTLSEHDYRMPTLDALIRECAVRSGSSLVTTSVSQMALDWDEAEKDSPDGSGDESPFVPNGNDLLELAVAHKPAPRAALYKDLGPEFESGYLALVQGDPARALSPLRLAVGKNPGSLIIRLELGRALAMVGEAEAARVELEKAMHLEPSDIEGGCLLAGVLLELHRYPEAETILLPIHDRAGAGGEAVFLLGQAVAGQGRHEEALRQFRHAVERDPGFHDAYFEAARLLCRRSDALGALRLLIQACSMAPEEIDYNRELVTLVLEHDLDVATGLAACDRLMVTDEENRWEYLGWIAELYLRRGWKREAVDPLKKAVELVPPERRQEKLLLRKRLVELEMHLT